MVRWNKKKSKDTRLFFTGRRTMTILVVPFVSLQYGNFVDNRSYYTMEEVVNYMPEYNVVRPTYNLSVSKIFVLFNTY